MNHKRSTSVISAFGLLVLFVTSSGVFAAEPPGNRLFGMRGYPAGWDDKKDATSLLPLIDPFGQYVHKDWPGKTKAIEDFGRHREEEAAELAKNPGPDGWNTFGGWQAGPRLESTGFFRTEKHAGRWWLVDPEGRLFWSNGIDCVRWATGVTPITDRKHWFQDLPQPDSPFAQFYGTGSHAAHGYYQDKSFETYNFTGANLLRKYGEDWKAQFAEICHRRLRSWGMNTIGNWSEEEIYRLRKTPYVATVRSGGRRMEGSSGYWGKFPDPFDPSFREALGKGLALQRGQSAGDPWCLGYFVDNELSWGDELSLAVAAMVSPADQPAKVALVADLKQKYTSIDKLNQAWATGHASWQSLLESRTPPDKKRQETRDDLSVMATRIAEQYFRTCRDAVKQTAPRQLYLGCRFAWANDRAVRAAAQYCDVVSFNRYQETVENLRLPEGVDKPVIIGEFHFGALDRGMFHPGLRKVADQDQRGKAYQRYVSGAMRHPLIVGTHWFQFGEQATTGRPDGENYQIGFLDICDTPYPETIRACRDVAATMYASRLSAKQGNPVGF